MKNTSPSHAAWTRPVLLTAAAMLLSSCAMPPRQAWNMIQRDGLFNYWAVAAGRPPMFVSRSTARPPLQSIAGMPLQRHGTGTLAYHPSHRPLGGGQFVTPSDLTYRSSPVVPYAPQTRYLDTRSAPSPAPRIASNVGPERPSAAPRRIDPPVRRTPSVNIPVEEPVASVAPTPRTNPLPTPDKPAASSTPPAPAAPKQDLPYGTPVAGRPNMVNSPYAQKSQLVDVAGMSAGQTVKCPYTGKLFKVPAPQSSAPRVESKMDAPKLTAPKTSAPAPKPDAKPSSGGN